LQIGNGGTTGSIHGDVVNNAQLTINRSDTVMFDSAVSGSGAFKQAGTGTTILTGASTYGGGTTIAAGTLQLGYGASTGWIVGDVNNNGTFAINRFDAVTFGGQISGSGAFKQLGYGSTTLSGANSYSGGTTIDAGTLLLAGAGTLGSVTGVTVINRWGALDLGGTAQAQSAVTLNAGVLQNGSLSGAIVSTGGTIRDIGGNTSLAASGGLTSLAGMNTYTGATNVTGGILAVDGVVAGTSAVNVMSGGVLSGSGTINSPTVTVGSGGIFAPGSGVPGSSANVVGSLAFEVGARYLVQINPSTASYANVTGLASLGGASVNAVFAPGAYVQKKYTILAASNGITGAFAPSVVNTDLPVNFRTDLSYDATHAYLDLTLTLASPSGGGLSENQRSVGNAIIGFFDRAGGIPMIFGALNGRGLTQVSGESGTSTQQTSFNAMNQFMGILSDPFSARGQGGEASSGGASGFAEETTSAYAAARDARTDAFAMFTKAPTGAPAERRWSVWAAGFGGSQSTDGSAAAGSSDTTSRIYGTAVGADYRILPGTTVGFALAGGGTSYSVSGLGSGRSDLFQGGGYVRQVLGQAYVQAALAYGWQDVTTNRTLTVGGIDQLQARFNTNTYSGRIEAGYRLLTPALGGMVFTPYAAGQFTALDLPAYAENVVAGASTFALAYGARNVTDTRSEVGFRTEKYVAVSNGIVGLRARVAWAHDFNTDRSVAATFQALPGASFVVSGARQAADAALTTASAEMNWMNGWSVAATFEGEFSNVTRSYAGKGGVKYQW
jgi:autotransporter-associated beta strand protein